MDEALVIARLIHFAAAMAGFGAAAFRFYAIDDETARQEGVALASFDRWNLRVLRGSALVMLLSGLAIVSFVAARMVGAASAALDLRPIATVLSATEFGHRWCWHLLFAALLITTAGFTARRHALALTWAALALASLGWVGHAADGSGWAGVGREANQSVHLLAAGLWLGGLLPLGWLLGRARHRKNGLSMLARQAVPAFSQMGYFAVALIAMTGAVNTLTIAGSVGALLDSDYGRLLSLKILLYLAMVAMSVRNRFRLAPPLASGRASTGGLYRAVLVEQAVGLAILAAVSVLGTWAPPAPHHHH